MSTDDPWDGFAEIVDQAGRDQEKERRRQYQAEYRRTHAAEIREYERHRRVRLLTITRETNDNE